MIPAGFVFVPGSTGKGSGGPFASASYTHGNRRLDFSYRWALGEVEYHMGESALNHKSYMRFLGVLADSEYTRFSRTSHLRDSMRVGTTLSVTVWTFSLGRATKSQHREGTGPTSQERVTL